MASGKRLIDADRAELYDAIGRNAFRDRQDIIDLINNQPTIDAVVVVRCKDCIRRYDTDECPMCFLSEGQYYEFTRDDGFCDRGERKCNG